MPLSDSKAWRFFASVKLALITLILLAATSIIGTVIKQGRDAKYYIENYGQTIARFLEAADFTRMYSSWWFVALLFIFALNLLVCSMERLPRTWRSAFHDSLSVNPAQLNKMNLNSRFEAGLGVELTVERIQKLLSTSNWKNPRRVDRDGSIVLFAQKGAWSRLGAYIVHLSILIILAGVILGVFFGFKAYVILPEGRATNEIYLRYSDEPLSLGFELYNDRFEKVFYPNGQIKQFRATLSVFDQELETPYRKTIVVNDPLSYDGITFYLGDSYPLEEYFVVLRDQKTAQEQAFRVPAGRIVPWPEAGVSFRIDELKRDQDAVVHEAKISLLSPEGDPMETFWMKNDATTLIPAQNHRFAMSFRQLQSVLLLAKKDPGVPIVFAGCILMVFALAVSFLMAHWRLWVQVTPKGKKGSTILVASAGNKNKPALERRFKELAEHIETSFKKDGKNRTA